MKKLGRLIPTLLCLSCLATAQPSLPEGPGQKLLKANCLICHSQEIIVSQRLSEEIWTKEVDKMAGWGSPIKDEDKKALVKYLSDHFSPKTPQPAPLRERFHF